MQKNFWFNLVYIYIFNDSFTDVGFDMKSIFLADFKRFELRVFLFQDQLP